MASKDPSKYQKDFSSTGFWDKVKKFAGKAGKDVIEKALILYYVWQDSETPGWAKTTIIGALGYFISPIDAIPDVLVPVGYTDDLAVLAMAITTVASYISEQHKKKAKEQADSIFG